MPRQSSEYSYQIDSILGGVSQQAPSVRRPDQCAQLDNAYINLTDGLHKRNPTNHLALAYSTATIPANGAKIHTIDRGTGEQFVLVLSNGAIKAFNATTGAAITVVDAGGYIATYCATTSPETKLKCVTVQDTTYILNTEKVVAKDLVNYAPLVSSINKKEGYLFVRSANYNQTYNVKILDTGGAGSYTYTTTTWDGTKNTGITGPGGAGTLTPATGYVGVTTESIAEDLKTKINVHTASHGITATRFGSTVQLLNGAAASNTFGSISVYDSVGNTSINLIYNQIDQAENFLPENCRDGFKVKVIGDPDRDIDDHYVEFVGDKNDSLTLGRGYWQESYKDTPYHTPLSSSVIEYNALDATTMPHKLTWNGSQLVFSQVTWTSRVVGDQTINPFPSFLGYTLTDLFFFQDRLGFVSEDNIIMSEQGYYYNFFRTSCRTLIDTDRIDVGISGSKVVKVNHVNPFSQYLLLVTDRSQFVLRGQDVLSPRTVTIIPATEFTSLSTASPSVAGRSVFLADNVGGYGMIREFLQIDANEAFDAFDITSQVPEYIDGTIKFMSASTNHDVLSVITDDKSYIYTYKYTWSGNQRIVSSWMRWEFNDAEVWGISWIKDWLIVMLKRDGGLYLERMNPTSGLSDSGLSFLTRLDRKTTQASCTETYTAATNLTGITIPYIKDTGATMVLVDNAGVLHQEVSSVNTTTTLRYFRGDLSASTYTIGQLYTMTYDPGEPILKTRNQDGFAVVGSGPMKVRRGRIRYKNSRLINVSVTVDSRDTFNYEHTVPTVSGTTTNSVTLSSGEYEFPVMGQADLVDVSITNSTPYPSNLVSMSWGISYRPKETQFR